MMTDEERARYAREQRERCRPLECHMSLDCWAVYGGKERMADPAQSKAARCITCGGKLRLDEWKYPRELALSPEAELEARNHNKRRL